MSDQIITVYCFDILKGVVTNLAPTFEKTHIHYQLSLCHRFVGDKSECATGFSLQYLYFFMIRAHLDLVP